MKRGIKTKMKLAKTNGVLLTPKKAIQYLPILGIIIVIFMLLSFVPRFYSPRNIQNILVQSSTLGIMALGMTLVYIIAGIDLSIPSVMAVASIVGAMYIKQSGGDIITGTIIILLIGTAVGVFNGFAISYLKMIPFVVTLAMMQVMGGLATWLTNSVSVALPIKYIDIMLHKIATLSLPVYIFIILTILLTFILKKTIYGRWLYAIGTNLHSANVCGIPAKEVIFFTYMISGVFAGLAGVLLSARLGAAGPLMGTSNVVLDIIGAAVIGGVSIYGGTGSPINAALGAVIISIMNNCFNLLRIDFFPAQVIKGVTIIAFVGIDSLRQNFKGR